MPTKSDFCPDGAQDGIVVFDFNGKPGMQLQVENSEAERLIERVLSQLPFSATAEPSDLDVVGCVVEDSDGRGYELLFNAQAEDLELLGYIKEGTGNLDVFDLQGKKVGTVEPGVRIRYLTWSCPPA